MQDVLIEKPYKFIPPITQDWVPKTIRALSLYKPHLRKAEGVVDFEIRHLGRLTESLEQGHGILMAPNHSRTSDPPLFGQVAQEAGCLFWVMASWHLFNQGWFYKWAIRALGGFSVYREGVDRTAIDYAIQCIEQAKRPLVLFPEGTTSRTNDRLMPMLDGLAFIARAAAKKRKKRDGGKVVVHPTAIRYIFQGDVDKCCIPVLEEIEDRITWRKLHGTPLLERISRVGEALLTLKEIEYFGKPQEGNMVERQNNLINGLLGPLEEEYFDGKSESGIIARIKAIRMKLLPEMARGEISEAEKTKRWAQLEDSYLAQQVYCYPGGYLDGNPSVERIIETVERFEEDLTDKARVHGNFKAIIDIGEPIEVSTKRDRKATKDPLMVELQERLESMIANLATESRTYQR